MKLILLVLVGLLNGCAISDAYKLKVKSWEGQYVSDLVASWGAPSNVVELPDGKKAYVWIRYGSTGTYGNAFTNPVGVSSGYAVSSSRWCKTTFIANSEWVEAWHIEGNSCR